MPDFLVGRWAKGYVDVGTPGGEESYISLSSYTDAQSAAAAAAVILSENTDAEASASFAAKVQPRNGDDEPFTNFGIGDGSYFPDMATTSTNVRVLGITMDEDPEGNPVWSLEVNTLIEVREEREARQVANMLPGGFDGGSDAVSNAQDLGPGVPSGALSASVVTTFSSGDTVQADVSGPVIFTSPVRLFRILLGCKVAPSSGPIHVSLFKNGVAFDTGITIPSGSVGPIDHYLNEPFTSLDTFVLAVVDPIPTGASGFTATVYQTTQI